MFEEVFFRNPRRLNLKIHSHSHKEQAEERQQSKNLNLDFYKRIEAKIGNTLSRVNITDLEKFQQEHELHPRL